MGKKSVKKEKKAKKEMIELKEHERIKKTLSDEIIRRDKIIEDLKRENELIMNTALKRSIALEEIRTKKDRGIDEKPSKKVNSNQKP